MERSEKVFVLQSVLAGSLSSDRQNDSAQELREKNVIAEVAHKPFMSPFIHKLNKSLRSNTLQKTPGVTV